MFLFRSHRASWSGRQKRGHVMVRSVVEEALALAAISLFLATVAVWAQVLGVV